MGDHPMTIHALAALLGTGRPWALLPETMALLSAAARGGITITDARERGSRRAELRTSPPAENTVAVLGVRGLITPRGSIIDALCGTSGGLEAFRAHLAEAVASAEVGSILLDIDSPGGQADLVAEAAADIRAARSAKPVVAVANTMAASAAYWLASQADEVVVTPSGLVGSVGAYVVHQDWSGFDAQLGVTVTLIRSGRYKAEGNGHQPLSDEARAHLQELVDDTYDLFLADVATGRGVSAQSVRDGYGEGRILTPERAVRAGLADRVDTIEATIARLGRGRESELPGGATARVSLTSPTPPGVGADDRQESAPAPGLVVPPQTEPPEGDEPDPEGLAALHAARRRHADLIFG